MKRFSVLTACLLPLLLAAQESYTIQGSLNPAGTARKAYLRYPGGEDTAIITKGRFVFTGKVTEPFPAMVIVDHSRDQSMGSNSNDKYFISVEPGLLLLEGADSVSQARITGGPVNTDLRRFSELTQEENSRMSVVQQLLRDSSLPADQRTTLKEETKRLSASFHAKKLRFIHDNPVGYFSLIMLRDYVKYEEIDTAQVKALFTGLSAELKNSAIGISLKKSLMNKSYTVNVGDMAPDFAQQGPDGKLIRLSELRGKYVLIDFWASWCKPCRAENPNLVRCFSQFRDKPFMILGVSLDMNRTSWLRAIKEDMLEWMHVSDLQYWQNDAALLYRIGSVPQNFLVDPDGKVIAVSLFGEELIRRLQEIFR